jgi:hypothetical protein
MNNTLLFDNLEHFSSAPDFMSYWSWQHSALNDTRHVMQWHDVKNSPADYLRTESYAGNMDFSVIGKNHAHLSPMGAIEWCWAVQAITRWRISIEMYFIHSDSKSQHVVELWQDNTILWRRGFTANLPVSDCLVLDTQALGGEIRLLVLSESDDIAYSHFVYRLKLYRDDAQEQAVAFKQCASVFLPQKNQMYAGLDNLPPSLQRKLYEAECAVHHLSNNEKIALQAAVTAKALHQLNLTGRVVGESGFYKLR